MKAIVIFFAMISSFAMADEAPQVFEDGAYELTTVCNPDSNLIRQINHVGANGKFQKYDIFPIEYLKTGRFPIQIERKNALLTLLSDPATTKSTIGNGMFFNLKRTIDNDGAVLSQTVVSQTPNCIYVNTGDFEWEEFLKSVDNP